MSWQLAPQHCQPDTFPFPNKPHNLQHARQSLSSWRTCRYRTGDIPTLQRRNCLYQNYAHVCHPCRYLPSPHTSVAVSLTYICTRISTRREGGRKTCHSVILLCHVLGITSQSSYVPTPWRGPLFCVSNTLFFLCSERQNKIRAVQCNKVSTKCDIMQAPLKRTTAESTSISTRGADIARHLSAVCPRHAGGCTAL